MSLEIGPSVNWEGHGDERPWSIRLDVGVIGAFIVEFRRSVVAWR